MNPIATIYRRSQALDASGQPPPPNPASDKVLVRDVPLMEFKTLSVTEPEVANQQQAIATHSCRIWGNPENPLQHNDYLTFQGRQLNIAQIIDREQNGRNLTLICGEETR